jgi:hypothetical protein
VPLNAPIPNKAPKHLKGTSLRLDIPRGPLPRPKTAGTEAPRPPSPSVNPPAPARAQPFLSIEQHASLSVELNLAPRNAADALARYRLNAAEKDALDAYWRQRMEGDPTLRAAWERAYRLYETWLRTQPGH